MGGIAGLFGGGPVGGIENQLTGIASGLSGPGLAQFQAGAAGQLTPSQQAAVNRTLGQMNLNTAGTYSNLGLGGSTMESQDLGANQLASLAQQQAFEAQSERLGLEALQAATGALGGAGTLAQNQQTQQLNALASAAGALGGKGAGGTSILGDVLGGGPIGDVLGTSFTGTGVGGAGGLDFISG